MKKILTFATLILIGTASGLLISRLILITQPRVEGRNDALQGSNTLQEQLTTWNKPTSNVQGFPLLKDEKNDLYIYDITNKKLVFTNYSTLGTGGASYFGDVDALPSNALNLTAFIDHNNDLYVISHETLQTSKLAEKVSLITAWSPDDSKLVYYRYPRSLSNVSEGPGPAIEKFNFVPNYQAGFFVFDLNTGATKSLYPLETAIDFVNNDTILSLLNDKLVTFNVNSFEADYKVSEDTFGFGTGQFNFATNGDMWTFTHSFKPTDDNNIILAKFPEQKGTIVESGGWADYQWPILSPDNMRIIYLKGPQFSESTWMYNTQTKIKKTLTTGTPITWINNDTVLVQETLTPKDQYPFYQGLKSVNTTTNEVTWLVKDLGYRIPHTL